MAPYNPADEERLHRLVPKHLRKPLGAYFTPAPLVETVLDCCELLVPPRGPLAIIDPSCGAGAFLHHAHRRFPEANLFGLELQKELADTCQRRIPTAHVMVGDALRGDFDRLTDALSDAPFELWLGNPPYNGTSSLLSNPKAYQALQRLLPSHVRLAKGGSLREDYIFFLLLAAQRVSLRRGVLAFVTSASLLDTFLYAPVREALLSRLTLRHVVHLGAGVFRDAQVDTCFTVWTTQTKPAAQPRFQRRPAPHAATAFGPNQLSAPIPFVCTAPEWRLCPPDPRAEALDALWRAQGEPLGTLIPIHFPGLKTRFDALLVDTDADRLWERVREFIEISPRRLAWFARRHGLTGDVFPKLIELKTYAGQGNAKANRDRIRPYFRYAGAKHREGIPSSAKAFCYLDRALIPRGDHRLRGAFDPHACPSKLVFNTRELPLTATVVKAEGCVHNHRHTRFAPLHVPALIFENGLGAARRSKKWGPPVLNLSKMGERWAAQLGSAAEVFARVAAFINSDAVQSVWAPAFGKSRELPIPVRALLGDA